MSLLSKLIGRKNKFILIQFDNMLFHYSAEPLLDKRGIGRVSRELLTQLTHIAQTNFSRQSLPNIALKSVYFYSSIHFCPDTLPQPSIVMIHDVIPLLFPDLYPSATVEVWKVKYKKIAQQAKKIITISKSSAADICRLLDISPECISVIYNGVTHFPPVNNPTIVLPSSPYLIFIGSKDAHKNVDVVFRAMIDPIISDVQLVMVGENLGYRPNVERHGLVSRVHFLGALEDKDMAFAITHAIALILPSLYEGFGLPPLEAALLRTPSICSQRPAMTEIMENVAFFVPPDNPKAWASAIYKLKNDTSFRSKYGQKAYKRANIFLWQKSANTLINKAFDLAND